MKKVNRRSALTIGLAAAASAVVTKHATAQQPPASAGKEIAPGVNQVDLGKRASMISAYKNVSMRDVVFQPKAKTSNPGMNNDMLCHCAEAELRNKQRPGMEFVSQRGSPTVRRRTDLSRPTVALRPRAKKGCRARLAHPAPGHARCCEIARRSLIARVTRATQCQKRAPLGEGGAPLDWSGSNPR